MKFTYIAAIIFVLSLPPVEKGKIFVEVSGIKPPKGNLYIGLYKEPSTFMKIDSAFMRIMIPVDSPLETAVLKNVPAGEYAIAIFHDRNNNGVLDLNELGIPKEGYGFSNNPKGISGQPKYENSVFNFTKSDTIHITMINNIFKNDKTPDNKNK